MLITCLVALVYPWRFRSRRTRFWVHLPLALVVMDVAYVEAADPAYPDIRFDFLMLWPLFLLVFICYGFKLFHLRRSDQANGHLP